MKQALLVGGGHLRGTEFPAFRKIPTHGFVCQEHISLTDFLEYRFGRHYAEPQIIATGC